MVPSKTATGLLARGLLRDSNGHWVWGFKTKIGLLVSFMSELWGLRKGLLICRDRRYHKVIVEVDLKSLVDMTGEINNEERTSTLVEDCRWLMTSGLDHVRVVHVFREGNRCADLLANLGQEGDWGTTILEDPLDALMDLLIGDAGGAATHKIR